MYIKNEKYINDSVGFEEVVKINFDRFLKIVSETPKWSQEKLATILKINSTTLRKYRREGRISAYTTKQLSKLLDIDQEYFNGKKEITEDIIKKIRDSLLFLNTNGSRNEENHLIKLLEKNITDPVILDSMGIDELAKLEDLLSKNIIILKAKIDIKKVIQKFNDEVNFNE